MESTSRLLGYLHCLHLARSAFVDDHKSRNRISLDFDTNKKVVDEVAVIPTKRLRNKVAGFVTVRYTCVNAGSRCCTRLM